GQPGRGEEHREARRDARPELQAPRLHPCGAGGRARVLRSRMGRWIRSGLAASAIAVCAVALAGCGLGAGKGTSGVTVTVTRNFGSAPVARLTEKRLPG